MARKIQNPKLDSKAARLALKAQGKPYWGLIEPGIHLGYRRPRGRRGRPGGAGAWVLRVYLGAGNYETSTIAVADDLSDSDGVRILSYWQAVDLVRRRAADRARGAGDHRHGGAVGRLTVRAVCEDYLLFLEGHRKSAADARWRCEALIYPVLGDLGAEKLDTDTLTRWQAGLVASPARNQPGGGADDAERVRRRKASANRVWAILHGALNRAVKQKKLKNTEWRGLETFSKVNVARLQFLSLDECRRLVNACDADFRLVVRAGLLTGARYGELCALLVRDFDADAGTVLLRITKSGKPRHVYLTAEGCDLFQHLAAGRAGDEHLLRRADGLAWGKSHQCQRMGEACAAARIVPAVGFHALRHSFASFCAANGMTMKDLADVLGHADSRITERHYVHFSKGHRARVTIASAPVFGFEKDDRVVAIGGRR
jgi:integrase